MEAPSGLFARVREFQKICWQVEWQSEEYRRDITNWERIYFTRKVSIWITYGLHNTAITPNQVTALWVFLAVLGAALLAVGDRRLSLLALVILFVSWILDNVDGELARYKKQFSIAGSLLDMVGHEISFSLIFCCLTLSVWWDEGPAILIVLGGLATAFVTPLTKMQENVKLLLCLQALSRGDRLLASRVRNDEPGGVAPARAKDRMVEGIGFLFTQTAMFYLLVTAVLFGWEPQYLAFYGVGIPAAFVPKYLMRARDLERLATDPQALRGLIRPEWLDD